MRWLSCTPPSSRGSQVSAEELLKELLSGQLEVCGDVGKYCGERSDTKRTVLWNRKMMLAMLSGRKPKMATRLAIDRIAKLSKHLGKIASRQIPGKPHTAITSSRTWWRRTTLGALPSSK